MVNAFPYLLLVLCYVAMAIFYKYYQKEPKKTKYINLLSIGIFLFFFGLRGFVAYDWTAYYNLYNLHIPDIARLFSTPYSNWPAEPGFTLLASLCKTISSNYLFFQVVCSTLNILLITRFFKRYTNNLPACLVLFLCMGGIGFCIDLMRNSLSIFIFLNGIGFIEKKKIVPYLLVCLLSASFHASGLAYIPFYFILNRKFNNYVLLGIFIVANFICILHIPLLKNLASISANVISPTAAQYLDSYMDYESDSSSAFNIGYLERLLTGSLVFCYIDKLRDLRKSNILVNSMFIYLFIILFLSEFRTISVRCSNLFVFAYWIMWQDLYKCIHYKNNKILYLLYVGSYCLLKTYSGNSGTMSQYYNVLFEHPSQNERRVYFMQHQNDDK